MYSYAGGYSSPYDQQHNYPQPEGYSQPHGYGYPAANSEEHTRYSHGIAGQRTSGTGAAAETGYYNYPQYQNPGPSAPPGRHGPTAAAPHARPNGSGSSAPQYHPQHYSPSSYHPVMSPTSEHACEPHQQAIVSPRASVRSKESADSVEQGFPGIPPLHGPSSPSGPFDPHAASAPKAEVVKGRSGHAHRPTKPHRSKHDKHESERVGVAEISIPPNPTMYGAMPSGASPHAYSRTTPPPPKPSSAMPRPSPPPSPALVGRDVSDEVTYLQTGDNSFDVTNSRGNRNSAGKAAHRASSPVNPMHQQSLATGDGHRNSLPTSSASVPKPHRSSKRDLMEDGQSRSDSRTVESESDNVEISRNSAVPAYDLKFMSGPSASVAQGGSATVLAENNNRFSWCGKMPARAQSPSPLDVSRDDTVSRRHHRSGKSPSRHHSPARPQSPALGPRPQSPARPQSVTNVLRGPSPSRGSLPQQARGADQQRQGASVPRRRSSSIVSLASHGVDTAYDVASKAITILNPRRGGGGSSSSSASVCKDSDTVTTEHRKSGRSRTPCQRAASPAQRAVSPAPYSSASPTSYSALSPVHNADQRTSMASVGQMDHSFFNHPGASVNPSSATANRDSSASVSKWGWCAPFPVGNDDDRERRHRKRHGPLAGNFGDVTKESHDPPDNPPHLLYDPTYKPHRGHPHEASTGYMPPMPSGHMPLLQRGDTPGEHDDDVWRGHNNHGDRHSGPHTGYGVGLHHNPLIPPLHLSPMPTGHIPMMQRGETPDAGSPQVSQWPPPQPGIPLYGHAPLSSSTASMPMVSHLPENYEDIDTEE